MRKALFALLIAAFVFGPSAAQAQAPAAEIAGGYSFARIIEGDGLNMPAGWVFTAAAPIGRIFAVVGEVSGNYKKEGDETLKVHFFQGGVRVSAPVNGTRPRPWAQFLAGGVNSSCCGEGSTDPSIEVGGGVDIPMGPAALRVGLSFPMVFSEGEVGNLMRFQAGVAFPLGKR